MSSTFDTMQHAIAHLESKIPEPTGQDRDVLHYLKKVASDLHDHSHATKDEPSRVAWRAALLLRTALRHEDDVDRKLYLDARQPA